MSELRPERAKKPGHLDIRLFGHVEVALDGDRFSLATPRKSLQVLAYLLLHRAAPVSREYLAFLLYPDDEESAARAKLRATLSEFPKILPHPADRYVSIDGDKVALNPAADLWLDVDAFAAASTIAAASAKRSNSIAATCCPRSTTNGSTRFASAFATRICAALPNAYPRLGGTPISRSPSKRLAECWRSILGVKTWCGASSRCATRAAIEPARSASMPDSPNACIRRWVPPQCLKPRQLRSASRAAKM